MEKKVSIIVLLFLILFLISISVCTDPFNANYTVNESPDSDTHNKLFNPSSSGTYSESDEKNQSIIDEAKTEIIRVFPDVNPDSLDDYSMDYDPANRVNDNLLIIFKKVEIKPKSSSNVQNTSSKNMFADLDGNIVTIKYDPELKRINFYAPAVYSPSIKAKRAISFEEAKLRSLEIAGKIRDENVAGRIGKDFNVISENMDEIDVGSGMAYTRIIGTYKGREYVSNAVIIRYDMILDRLIYYSDNTVNSEYLHNRTALSPVPDITYDKAKQILENKISENYNIDDFDLRYYPNNLHKDSLVWLDYGYEENNDPVRLVWLINYNTSEERNKEGYNERLDVPYEAIIDAHTGDIIYLKYKDIAIGLN